MKISEKISYPYPIWGWYDNYKTEKAECHLVSKLDDSENFTFSLEVVNVDAVINQLIKEHKAVYACIATCSSTFYNKYEKVENPVITININRDDVFGNVNVKFLIVATCDIPDYHNPNLDDFYEGQAFLPKGAAIALLYDGDFDAYASSGKSLGDVIKVVKNTWSDKIETDLSDLRIRIALPEKEYNVFDKYGSNHYSFLHSTIVYNALLKAVEKLPEANDEYDWVKYLTNEIKAMEDVLNVDDLQDENENGSTKAYSISDTMKIVNRILKRPIQRAFNEILDNEITNSTNDTTDNSNEG